MTNAAENELLTRVGPGTPMGGLMRRFWMPALKSSEIEADGEPRRFMLLGEKLIAFRDSSGKVGVMDHRCPHRCASLFFGRNEDGGIRCVYHGWKFDVDGNCLDMANVPPHQDFKAKVKARAYKAAERNGLIWVYMGDQASVPPLPDLEVNLVPEDQVNINFQLRECNWLQAVEGELDTSHVGFLHLGHVGPKQYSGASDRYTVINRAPEYVIKETEYGISYGAYRPADEGETYWRVAHFAYPCWTMPPLNPIGVNISARAYVPLDDEHTMIVVLLHKEARSPERDTRRRANAGGTDFNYLPNTTDWLGRWRLRENKANDYGIDRDLQRTSSYTGIGGIILQDQAVTESMDPVVDRTFERLAPSDQMITRTRNMLLRAVRDHERDGAVPAGAAKPELFATIRGGGFTCAADADWWDTYTDTVKGAPLQVTTRLAGE